MAGPEEGTDLGLSGAPRSPGVKVYICKPADPEAKGMLERFHDYPERSFLPGRDFTSPEDFNTQLSDFTPSRGHRSAGA